MEWLNLQISLLGGDQFRIADEKTRGVWVSLMVYCAHQENDGIIDHCKKWTAQEWQRVCGIRKKMIEKDSSLWSWLDNDLIVQLYPTEKQKQVQALRLQARTAAMKRWGAKRHADDYADWHGDGIGVGNAEVEVERKGSGKEGEGEVEAEWTNATPTALSGLALVPTTKPPQERLRFRLERHGSKLEMAGKPIFHEWIDVCRGYKIGWIEKIFDEVETVSLPSDLRRILKMRESTYAPWKESQRKETERTVKATK